ncbi:MAG: phosphatase 2C-like domain-containing protein [Benniella sp.]|nr:MAG: phosphatase 2C-like domain-containing protein [Benniella sp.]
MLGRNAARPLGVTPSRLVAAYNAVAPQRLAQWMFNRPYAIHMHRYLFPASQLLLTTTKITTTITSDATISNTGKDANVTATSAASGASGSREVHTSSAAAMSQPQLAQDPLLPSDLYSTKNLPLDCDHPYSSSSPTATAPETTAPSTTPSLASENAITFNYLLAASWHPKSRQQQEQEDVANAERTMRWKQKLRAAHPPSRPYSGNVDAGEDAFFHVSTPSRVALGVADGVGGWAEMGVDPSLFSWALMNNAENIARLTDKAEQQNDASARNLAASSESSILDAQSLLDGAYNELVQSGTVEAGSSTACILSLCKLTGTLRASSLGDSAFLLIRDNQCIYESPSQQHFWNCPYQLTVLPPKLRQQQQQDQQDQQDRERRSRKCTSDDDARRKKKSVTETTMKAGLSKEWTERPKKKSYVQDSPKDAVQSTHQLQDGDVIVLATDGFWDNVFTKEAIELVDRELGDIIRQQQQHRRQQDDAQQGIETVSAAKGDSRMNGSAASDDTEKTLTPEMSADEILARVRALSKRLTNTARRFSLDSKRMTPFSQGARHVRCGGKVDDITVIVTLVRSTRPCMDL